MSEKDLDFEAARARLREQLGIPEDRPRAGSAPTLKGLDDRFTAFVLMACEKITQLNGELVALTHRTQVLESSCMRLSGDLVESRIERDDMVQALCDRIEKLEAKAAKAAKVKALGEDLEARSNENQKVYDLSGGTKVYFSSNPPKEDSLVHAVGKGACGVTGPTGMSGAVGGGWKSGGEVTYQLEALVEKLDREEEASRSKGGCLDQVLKATADQPVDRMRCLADGTIVWREDDTRWYITWPDGSSTTYVKK